MSQSLNSAVAVIGIDIGKNTFHVGGLDGRGAIVLLQKWSRGQIGARLANMPAWGGRPAGSWRHTAGDLCVAVAAGGMRSQPRNL
jgi:hypothetical protein